MLISKTALTPHILKFDIRICRHFWQDSKLVLDESQKEPFLELHRILEALKQEDLTPALQ